MAQKKSVNPGSNLDFEQLRNVSLSEVQQKIIALGADYSPVETKTDLMARLLQLQGTQQPIDQLRKQLAEAGIGEDGIKATDLIPKLKQRLTPAQLKKIAEKYVAKGMKLLISKDGQLWEIRFECEQLTQNGRIVKAKRKDSGNTMIPANVFKTACETITTFAPIKRKAEADAIPDDYEELADGEAA